MERCMHHDPVALADEQRLVPQPVDKRLTVRGREEPVEGVMSTPVHSAERARYEVDIVVTQDSTD